MPNFKVQIRIPHGNGLPADTMTNSFWVDHVSASKSDMTALLVPHFETYYDEIFEDAGTSANYMDWDGAELWVYDMADAPPRVAATQALDLSPNTPAATVIPPEVAVVISAHTLYVPGIPRGSQRNRVYIGGLANNAFDVSTSTVPPVFDGTFLNHCATAAGTLKANLASASGDGLWVIYSPTRDQAFAMHQGWIDNAPDTQRRRGVATSTRVLWG